MRFRLLAILSLALVSPSLAESDPPILDQPAPSGENTKIDLKTLEELFPNGAPNLLTPESLATSYHLPPSVQPHDAPKKLPTGFDYADGPVRIGLGSKVTPATQAPSLIPSVPDPKIVGGAAGGTGELNGQVTYAGDNWELYGAQTVGVAQPDGSAPAVSERTTVGSTFRLPDWLSGGKLNASVEFADTRENKTRVEYRQQLGPAEGFVAAEQRFQRGQVDQKQQPTSIRGGVIRKF
jgi:hypothetical protein